MFKKYFFKSYASGDEYYWKNVYKLQNVTLEHITSIPSQFYVFCTSIINFFVENPLKSTKIMSLISFTFLMVYFYFKLKKFTINKWLKIQFFIILLFVTFLTRQALPGTSDFTAYPFLIIFIIELNQIVLDKEKFSFNKIIFLSLVLALSIVTRPTVLIILLMYSFCLLLFQFKNIIHNKLIFIIPLVSLFIISLFNYGPIKNERKILLDVKEAPDHIDTNWLERNYLMAKFWDEGKHPQSHWVDYDEAINYKKDNPSAFIPKSYFDLLIHEPVLYLKQMVRMFISANFSLFSYTNVLYLLAIYILFAKFYKIKSFTNIVSVLSTNDRNKIVLTLVTFYLSVLVFSFLAIKMFEYRWVIPIMIILVWYILSIIPKFDFTNKILLTYYILFSLWIIRWYQIFLI